MYEVKWGLEDELIYNYDLQINVVDVGFFFGLRAVEASFNIVPAKAGSCTVFMVFSVPGKETSVVKSETSNVKFKREPSKVKT